MAKRTRSIRKPEPVDITAAMDFAEKKTQTKRKRAPSKAVKSSERATEAASKSGLVPEGDVRLTANIRGDLHLKLKIEAAKRRTTIGELIEGLTEEYL